MTSHATFSYFILYRKPCYKKYHKCKFSCDIGQLHLLCVGEGTEGWEERQRSRTLTQLASIVFIFSFSATDTDFYLCLGSGENEVLKDSPPLFFFFFERKRSQVLWNVGSLLTFHSGSSSKNSVLPCSFITGHATPKEFLKKENKKTIKHKLDRVK